MENLILILCIANVALLIVAIFLLMTRNNRKHQIKDAEKYQEELRTSYNKGFADAEKKQNFEIMVYPWKEDIEEGIFKTKKRINIGYKYQLFVNGFPCFEPHICVCEELSAEHLNEKSIQFAVGKVMDVINMFPAANSITKIAGNGAELTESLVRLVAKK